MCGVLIKKLDVQPCGSLRISHIALGAKSQFPRPTSLQILPTITWLLLLIVQMQCIRVERDSPQMTCRWPNPGCDISNPHLILPFWWFTGRRYRSQCSSQKPSIKTATPWEGDATVQPQSKWEKLSCADASCWNWDNAQLSTRLMKKVTKLLHRHQTNLVSQTVSSSKPHYE